MRVREDQLRALIAAETDSCILWPYGQSSDGYGKIYFQEQSLRVHRVAYFIKRGTWPKQALDHLCRVPLCINHLHLEDVSIGENVLRGQTLSAANKAKTECLRGHAFTLENTWIEKDGRRHCKSCWRIQNAKKRARTQEEEE